MKRQLLVIVIVVISCCILQAKSSWIDPDSSPSVYEVTSLSEKKQFQLVFSDEFNVPGRSFADGSDPRWTAMNKNDYTNDALQYYKDTLVSTMNGHLNITTLHKKIVFDAYSSADPKATMKQLTKSYQSGMIQSWNKFCFTGGIIEVSAQLPGKYDIGGLWPAVWLLGNLARATYVGSSDNV
jgi:beta-glucan synthesis-associated protein KRE6